LVHAIDRLLPRPVVAPVAEVQVHPAAQELDFIVIFSGAQM
jgi:hypothetical protein